jgi:hypothetical protein
MYTGFFPTTVNPNPSGPCTNRTFSSFSMAVRVAEFVVREGRRSFSVVVKVTEFVVREGRSSFSVVVKVAEFMVREGRRSLHWAFRVWTELR